MKVVGLTGGVGAGKSTVLKIIKENCNCYILIADEVAHEIEKKGNKCYSMLVDLLSDNILGPDGEIDKSKMAAEMFKDKELVGRVNAIVHPLVKEYVLKHIEDERRKAVIDYFFIEAALLLEDGYRQICDEMWYVHACTEVRKQRLMESRGYSEEKVQAIMDKQCSEIQFRNGCDYTIENDGDLEKTTLQIINLLSNNNNLEEN